MTMRRLSLLSLVVVVVVVVCASRPARAAADEPRLELAPASLSFADAGETQTLTVRNAGGGVLHLGAVSIVVAGGRGASDFRVDATIVRELAAGQETTVTVTFRPIGTAVRQSFAALLVPADDPRLLADLAGAGPAGRRVATVALRARESHLLTWIVLLPLLGALGLALLAGRGPGLARAVAAVAAGGPLALAALALARFDSTVSVADAGFGAQLVSHRVLLRGLGFEYFVGVDGLSITFVVLAALLGAVATATAFAGGVAGDRAAPPAQPAALLVVQAGASGAFVALDGLLWWCFWLVAITGAASLATAALAGEPAAPARRRSPYLVGLFGAAAVLIFVVRALHARSGGTYLCDGTPSPHTYDLLKLAHANVDLIAAARPGLGVSLASVAFWALVAAFAMTAGLFPFQRGAADVHARAPAGASALLAGLLPAMAIYGLARVGYAIVPSGALAASTGLAALGAAGVLHGALLARGAADVRRLFAAATTARLGFCLIGLARASTAGLSGALAQAFASGLAAALVFTLADAVLARGATLDDADGLAARAPRAAPWLVFAALASTGAPGLATSVGPALVVVDAFGRHAFAALVALAGFAVATGAHARLARRVLSTQPSAEAAVALVRDLDRRALVRAVPLGVLLLALGLVPAALLDLSASSVRDLGQLLAPR